jgi:hypothetical protein
MAGEKFAAAATNNVFISDLTRFDEMISSSRSTSWDDPATATDRYSMSVGQLAAATLRKTGTPDFLFQTLRSRVRDRR